MTWSYDRRASEEQLKDYYAILGLKPGCEKNDVRRAYRSKAKKVHPDLTREAETSRFLALREAYEVLLNSVTRDAYDKTRRARERGDAGEKWNYHDILHTRKDDPMSLANLICYDLLHDMDAEAVDLYDEAQTGGFFSLRRLLDREDFMDYAFLLAEAYLERDAVVKAYRLFRGIAELEEEDPYFRHFYIEVLDRMASIVRQNLPDDPDGRQRIAFLEDLVTLSYPAREEAKLRKLLSELLTAVGEHERAANEVFRAFALAPTYPGLAATVETLKSMGFRPPL